MERDAESKRFAQRVLHGVGEDGVREEIVIWIERRPGAVWSVGRAIDPKSRSVVAPGRQDFVFEGYEMGDALEAANNALSDDLRVSSGDGLNEDVELERWFFGHPLH